MNILVSACLLGVNCTYKGTSKEQEALLHMLKEGKHTLIPICPEQLGGMSTPRFPSERKGEQVISCEGKDVTEVFRKGASEALRLAQLYDCKVAILKERSPSCGSGQIYDGTFTGNLIEGDGVTAELLKKYGMQIIGETELNIEQW